MKKVTIIIPTYNRSNTIKNAVQSVIKQDYPNVEIIVIDDGSTDNTEEVLKSLNIPELRIISNESNKGQNVARNIGLESANGEYISYLDSDDIFLNGHLKKSVNTLNELPEQFAGVLVGMRTYKDEGVSDDIPYKGEISKDRILNGEIYEGVSGLTSITFRRDILKNIGYHDESMPKNTDIDFYLQILDEYKLYGETEILANRYKRGDNVSLDANRNIRGEKKLLNKYGDQMSNLSRSIRYYQLSKAYGSVGKFDKARSSLIVAMKNHPKELKYYYHYILTYFGNPIFSKFSGGNIK